MADFSFKYGDGHMDFSFPDEDIIKVIEPAHVTIPEGTEEEKIAEAINNPLGTGKLEEIIKPTDTVCILVPDMTRQWGRPAQIMSVLVPMLEKIGVKDENMLIVSATGTHKAQTPEEHALIVGQDIYDRIKMVDHNCDENLQLVGTSFRGNEIWVNKTVMSYDKKIIIGSTVFHFLAGFGGSRKYVLPGIAGRDTIMSNHSQYFAEGGVGSGQNPLVSPGRYEDNPINREMFEAAEFAGIDFNITGVIGPDKKIAFCYAGDIHKSHEAAVEKCRLFDGAVVDEPGDMVIASGMGFPKDINLYQTAAKPMNNAVGVLKKDPNSVMIVASECREGVGSSDTDRMLHDFDNAHDREVYTRENYTIGLNVAYFFTQYAEDFHVILVSSLDPDLFKKTKVHTAKDITEAIELAKKLTGKEHFKAYIMPYAASTCGTVKH
ncbi:MAG: nickel-dependent lactate racemase [Clostridiales bacterium]|nr:nickel-dependent lactate racemase [Clostridiales bacterium]